MRKKLILLRHAKTEPFFYAEDDFKRNLTEKGIADCGIVSRALKNKGIAPQYIVASPANRTTQTAHLFKDVFGIKNIQFEQNIYDGLDLVGLFEILATLPNEVETVLFIGHNPGIFQFACELINDFIHQVPTCCAIVLETNTTDWKEMCSDSFSLKTIETPQLYK